MNSSPILGFTFNSSWIHLQFSMNSSPILKKNRKNRQCILLPARYYKITEILWVIWDSFDIFGFFLYFWILEYFGYYEDFWSLGKYARKMKVKIQKKSNAGYRENIEKYQIIFEFSELENFIIGGNYTVYCCYLNDSIGMNK
jgi:hypothetical protein